MIPQDPSQADPTIVSLMHGLSVAEGTQGGQYTKMGDPNKSGQYTASGIGQWSNQVGGVPQPLQKGQVPLNFQGQAKQYGLDPNDFSPANQNKVLYASIASGKAAGLTPEQILSQHNSGRPNAYLDSATSTGTGSVGAYDVGAYVKKAMTAAQQYAAQQRSANPVQALSTTAPVSAPIVNTSNERFNTIANGAIGLAKGLVSTVTDPIEQLTEGAVRGTENALGSQATPQDYANAYGGGEVGKLTNIFGDKINAIGYDNGVANTNPLQTVGQVAGDAGMTALNAFTGGEGSAAIDAAKSTAGLLGDGILKTLAKGAAKGSLYGAGYGLTNALANDSQSSLGTKALDTTIGAGAGAALGIGGAVLGGIASKVLNSGKLTEAMGAIENATKDMTPAEVVAYKASPEFEATITKPISDNGLSNIPSIQAGADAEVKNVNDFLGSTRKTWMTASQNMVDDGTAAIKQFLKSYIPTLTSQGTRDTEPTLLALQKEGDAISENYNKLADTVAKDDSSPYNKQTAQGILDKFNAYVGKNQDNLAVKANSKSAASILKTVFTDANGKNKPINFKSILDARSFFNSKWKATKDDGYKVAGDFLRDTIANIDKENPTSAAAKLTDIDNARIVNLQAQQIAKYLKNSSIKEGHGLLANSAAYAGLHLAGGGLPGVLGFAISHTFGGLLDKVLANRASLAMFDSKFTKLITPDLAKTLESSMTDLADKIEASNIATKDKATNALIDTATEMLGNVNKAEDVVPIARIVNKLPEGKAKETLTQGIVQAGDNIDAVTKQIADTQSNLAQKKTDFENTGYGEPYIPEDQMPIIDAGKVPSGSAPPEATPDQATAYAKMQKSGKGLPTILASLAGVGAVGGAVAANPTQASAMSKPDPKEVSAVNTAVADLAQNNPYPNLDPRFAQALVQKESSGGTNDTFRTTNQGKYGWLVGFTKKTYDGILAKASGTFKGADGKTQPAQRRYKNLLSQLDFSTPATAIKSGLAYASFLDRNFALEAKTGNKEYQMLSPDALYKKYNAEPAADTHAAQFKQIIDSTPMPSSRFNISATKSPIASADLMKKLSTPL